MNRGVLITGGSRGIGAACVEAFVAQGDRVFFIYHSNHIAANRVCEKTGAIAYAADLSDPDDVRAAVCRAEEALGGIDVLVNNAGGSGALIGKITQFEDAELDTIRERMEK